jgi:hypothetical protein
MVASERKFVAENIRCLVPGNLVARKSCRRSAASYRAAIYSPGEVDKRLRGPPGDVNYKWRWLRPYASHYETVWPKPDGFSDATLLHLPLYRTRHFAVEAGICRTRSGSRRRVGSRGYSGIDGLPHARGSQFRKVRPLYRLRRWRGGAYGVPAGRNVSEQHLSVG